MQGDGQLDDAEVGAEVAAADGHRLDEEVPDLGGQLGELVAVEGAQIAWLLIDSSMSVRGYGVPGVRAS